MASYETESSASTILVSCKQTRFHIASPVYQALDISGLGITVTTGESSSGVKGKGKSKSAGLELLVNGDLKVNGGVHYGLIGRNGTGKSTILRAIAEKLIPGIPEATRIAILQQTSAEPSTSTASQEQEKTDRPVIEYVINKATSRDDIQHEIDILLEATEAGKDALAPVRAIRSLRHAKLKKQLFEMEKDARLRSGARGFAARKALVAFQEKVTESAGLVEQPDEEIDEAMTATGLQAALDQLTELQSQVEPSRLSEIESKARGILSGLGFREENLKKKVTALSGGWRMRCDLAAVLLQDSDILILDEPTNFLDLLGIIWLQQYILGSRDTTNTTLLLVTHDRAFIDTVCQEIIILRDQKLTYFRGNIQAYEEEQRSKKLHLGRMQEAQNRQKAHVEKTIQNNIKAGKATGDENKLRQAKSRQKKLDDRMGMQVNASGHRFKLNRDLAGYHFSARAEIDIPADEKAVSIHLPLAPDLRFPGPLVSLEGVNLKYKTSPGPILQDMNFNIHMGDRVGIVGLNGSGKSTLIKLITETIRPSKGTVTKHPRLRLGYYSQHAVEDLKARGTADPSLTALSLAMKDKNAESEESDMRGLLGSLGLPGRTASDVPVAKLSGGQLVRLALALIVWDEPQLLVLDEITTHLDFHTVTALADALSGWNGAILVVSHDRFFIRVVVEGERLYGDGKEDENDDDEEEVARRRREVFLLKEGRMKVLAGGVKAFEESLEKRVEKLLSS